MGRYFASLVLALALVGCVKKNVEVKPEANVETSSGVSVVEQVIKICDRGWIILRDGQRMYAPGGSEDRWLIANGANEDDICYPNKEAQVSE